MQAVQVQTPGGPDALQLVALPEPQAGAGEVRVRAQAIGVGRPDALIRNGTYKWMPPLPAIPGAELAGLVDQVGHGVTQWAVGDRVLVSARDLTQRGGCYVQSIVVPEAAPYRLPDAIAFTDAVSLPNLQLAQALLLGLNGGRADARSVLITGASGGVATMLAQLARHHQMLTLGTARTTDKRAFAMANGFDAVLDPAEPNLPQRVKALTEGVGVDLALDPIGGQTLIDCLHSLAPLGTAVSYNIVAGPPAEDVFATLRSLLGRSLAVRCFSMHTFDEDTQRRRAVMQGAIDLMAAGHVKAPTPTLLPLAEARQAHVLLDSGMTTGKIVLQP
ncbi:MAG: zinc-dependent alcohol dehydrogenase family protein [Hydrogenophaga sp.]|nr:zinc-dependent alcohol dehydrogenase family protein [Hydrogenophaga sp.]